MNYAIGDKVQHADGGPEMQIIKVYSNEDITMLGKKIAESIGFETGDCVCEWQEEANEKRKTLKPSNLKKI